MESHFAAIVTLAALLLSLATLLAVGYARNKYQVRAPATTGNENFERLFRVQMNTQENLILFLPALWLFNNYVSSLWAGILGVVWLLGRVDYAISYSRAASKRSRGFGISMLAFAILAIGAAVGLGAKIISGQ
ncbi:MAG: MAPEG family protein [Gammaproteobacteria bacterium]|nr:MAG: MAPEG family protein [Gammaproteobacteria bacterium]